MVVNLWLGQVRYREGERRKKRMRVRQVDKRWEREEDER